MHVVRKSEGGKMRRWGERARERSWIPCVRRHIRGKSKDGPDWALNVLDGVVSSVLSSSVVLCWLQCDWLQLDSGCKSSIGSVDTASASVVLECVFMYTSVTNNAARNSTGQAETLKNLGRLVSISMHHLLYWEMSVTNICLGGCCVFSCISLHNGGVASFGLLQCVIHLWLKVGKKGRRGKGPSVAQCPKLPTL